MVICVSMAAGFAFSKTCVYKRMQMGVTIELDHRRLTRVQTWLRCREAIRGHRTAQHARVGAITRLLNLISVSASRCDERDRNLQLPAPRIGEVERQVSPWRLDCIVCLQSKQVMHCSLHAPHWHGGGWVVGRPA